MEYRIKDGARVAVIGYGSWATAIMKMLSHNEKRIYWHITNPEVKEHLLTKKTNPKYLSDVHFNISHLSISPNINHVVSKADIIILATPSAFLEKVLAPLKSSLKDKFVVTAIKGIIPGDYLTIAEYINQKYDLPFDQIGVFTGPCHAEEVALERLSYLNVVCKDNENGEIVASKLATPYVNINIMNDIYGTEYSAVMKNIYAICAGICYSLGYGDNFLSVLIANAANEIDEFLNKSYPSERTTNSSAYIGDLLVTCYSQFSRNRTFGLMIGKGYSVKSAQMEMNMVAEGYYAAACIHQIAQDKSISIPIAEAVYQILYKGANARIIIRNLTKQLK